MTDRDMLTTLLDETREQLAAIEPDLLALERDGAAASADGVNRLFRAMHNIKGGFGFAGIDPIVELAHALENTLDALRGGTLDASPALVDALLSGIDRIRAQIADPDHAHQIPIREELARLAGFLPGSDAALPAFLDPAEARMRFPELTDAVIDSARRSMHHLFLVTVGEAPGDAPPEAWRGLVEPLAFRREGRGGVWLVATPLDADLIAEALSTRPESVRKIDLRERSGDGPRPAPSAAATPDAPPPASSAQAAPHEESLRVPLKLLNALMNLAGELVLARNQLQQVLARRFAECDRSDDLTRTLLDASLEVHENCPVRLGTGEAPDRADLLKIAGETLGKRLAETFAFPLQELCGLNRVAQSLDLVTTRLQEGIMRTRLQPLSSVTGKFPRVVRDLARRTGKEIRLALTGQEVELDKSILELLFDPLNHLIRNAADHGLEPPDERERIGKPRTGTIELHAFQEGGKVVLRIRDDGAGLPTEAIRRRAVERGLLAEEAAHASSAKELHALVFRPGFSTARAVSDVSGRGVGMDVVKNNIERLGGTIELDSAPGRGLAVILRLPITLAIIPSLLVSAAGRSFAVPQGALVEVVRIRPAEVGSRIERIQGAEILKLRGMLLPVVRLADALGLPRHRADCDGAPDRREGLADQRRDAPEAAAAPPERRRRGRPLKILVLRLDRRVFGLAVDEVRENEEIVVKPLPGFLRASIGYSGVTIMGDGAVAMILNPAGIAELAKLRFPEEAEESADEKRARERAAAAKRCDLLVFRTDAGERLAVPLSEVARIEKRRSDEIQRVGNEEFIPVERGSLRLVHPERILPLARPEGGAPPSHRFVIVPRVAGASFGLATPCIEDTVHAELAFEPHRIAGDGVRGGLMMQNRLVIVLDLPRIAERMAAGGGAVA